MKAQTIQPGFWVTQGLGHIAPSEALVMSGIAVRSQTVANIHPLLIREELGGIGVVIDEPVRRNRDNNCGNTFLILGPVSALISLFQIP